MNIEQVMNKAVHACSPQDSAKHAAQLMWDQDIGCLPVIDQNRKPVAMVTDRDLLMASHLSGKRLETLSVGEAMSKQLHVARVGESLQAVTELMRAKQVRRLPVVDNQGKLAGIVSLNDLALAGGRNREVKAEDVAATLASICQPRRPAQPTMSRH